MRSYQQFCSLARALDIVGDRWTLLIIRELAVRPCRYTDLRDGLPSIATNLLAQRLRDLQTAGVVTAKHAPAPVATTLYSLTEWGHELRPILLDLGRWGSRLLGSGPKDEDQFRSRWVALAMQAIYADADLSGLEGFSILIDTGGDPVVLDITEAGFDFRPASPEAEHDMTLRTSPEVTVAVVSGRTAITAVPAHERLGIQADATGFARFDALLRRLARARP